MDSFYESDHRLCIFCFRKPANSKQAWPGCHTAISKKVAPVIHDA